MLITSVLVTQAATTLPRVQDVTVSNLGEESAKVQWAETSEVASYQLRLWQQTETGEWEPIRLMKRITRLNKTIQQLEADTQYQVQVRAARKQEYGRWSKKVTFATVGGDCTSNRAPEFSADITNLNQMVDIVPPPSLSGTILKTHSFINTALERVPVYAPFDATFTGGAYYLEGNPDGEYMLIFQMSCEMTFNVDHITEPVDAIRHALPDEPKDNTMTDTPTAEVVLAAGDLIGYTTGTMYGIWDFGVYDAEVVNQFADDPAASGRDINAVCPYDYYPTVQRSQYYDVFARADNREYPGAEELCTAEVW